MNMKQLNELISIIESNTQLMKVFDALDHVGLEEYYIGAGVIAQSVWNNISGFLLDKGVSDVDVVYFDADNANESDEQKIIDEMKDFLKDFPLWIDLKNQARVHTLYKEKFGYSIEPYISLEEAISSWATTSTAFGVRREKNGDWIIYAPFGIKDIFDMKIKANTRQITEEIYMAKVDKWLKRWPKLSYEPWNEIVEPIIYDQAIKYEHAEFI